MKKKLSIIKTFGLVVILAAIGCLQIAGAASQSDEIINPAFEKEPGNKTVLMKCGTNTIQNENTLTGKYYITLQNQQ